MTIWVTDLLEKCGIRKEIVRWNAQAAEDEIDIVIDVTRFRVFIELKDREFSVGDAYPFTFRLERYGGTFGVILTMSQVSEEARRFLEERRMGGEGFYIESLERSEGIEQGVPRLIDQVSQLAVFDLVDEAFGDFGIDNRQILRMWMSCIAHSCSAEAMIAQSDAA